MASASLSPAPSSSRLVALDAFRGATMALMVLVNNGGGPQTYAPLLHADWHGWTITDMVFPSFLWIVGVAITLSLGKRLERGVSKSELLLQALRRAAIIFALGLFVYLFPHFRFGTMRILGVLQRIAICYFIASAIYLWTPTWRALTAWIAGLLVSYWMLMTLVPVPGFGAGRLDVAGNLAHYVDSIVLGVHNYAWTKTWDPEGIVSTLPAIATVLFGVVAGQIVARRETLVERITRLFVLGNVLLVVGLICDIWLPINKKLWTSSFALFMGGIDFVMLALFLYVVDERKWQRATRPFVIFGMNAIAIYMLSEVLAETLGQTRWLEGAKMISLQQWLYTHCFAPFFSPYNASLAWAVSFVLLMYAAAYALYRKGWFLRV